MIDIHTITHIHPGSRKTSPRTALRALSMRVPHGSFTILAGPNGSGKSTLFRLLCGLGAPSDGRITIDGYDPQTQAAQARARMAVVFQSPAVDKHLSVGENLKLHGRMHGLSGQTLQQRQADALSWTGLKDRLGDTVGTLSGGLARQVELAKCLLTNPALLLLDEPTTGLDAAGRRAFQETLLRLKRNRGMTILMTTHLFEEAENADAVAILKEGRLVAHDSPDRLRKALGRDVIVVGARNPDHLAPALGTAFGVQARIHGEEVRIEDLPPEGPAHMVDRILSDWRSDITSVSVKQPTLEDVFIHLTAQPTASEAPISTVSMGASS